ncbi:MAG: hypothetical protein ACXAB9_13035 [Candidatus Thorarchaeota archaeon]
MDATIVVGQEADFVEQRNIITKSQVTWNKKPIYDGKGNPIEEEITSEVIIARWKGEEKGFGDFDALANFLHKETGLDFFTTAEDESELQGEGGELILGIPVLDAMEWAGNSITFDELHKWKLEVKKALPVEVFPSPKIQLWIIL